MRAPATLAGAQVLWLAGALALVVLPHAGRVPVWSTALFVALALWRLAQWAGRAQAPGRVVRLGLGLAVVAGVYASYGGIFGRNPGVALLVAFSGLKLLETRDRRDAFVGVLLGYFLVVTHLLYAQSIPTGLYLTVALTVLTGTLVGLSVPAGSLPGRRQLGLAGALLLQASPLAVALFLLFPRLPGPLWTLPADAHSARSGLDDTMSPGIISQLGLSDEVAFRVRFAGEPPARAALYWRGPVLWTTDGRVWSAGEGGQDPAGQVVTDAAPIRYSVTLEPHGRRWLYLLDLPVESPPGSRVQGDLQVLAATPVRQRLRYEAASATRYWLPGISERQRRQALDLPPARHPKAGALAREWAATGASPEERVGKALTLFRDQPFVYSLNPPLMLDDPVDEFLFGARKGFCEHYAAAFVVLMRAAGVPARVVTGYQGGETNPLDGYLVVRQRDAHAWAEVWLEDRGWVRVDPTAAVSPARVERGFNAALPEAVAPLGGFVLDEDSGVYRLLRGARHSWDAANNWWNQWVLGYEQRRQRELLARVGIDPGDWRRLGTALALLTGVPLLVLALALRLRRGRRVDPARRLYDRFCRTLARRGVVRAPQEPPLAFARRAAHAIPREAGAIEAFVADYVALRYAREGGDLARLRDRLRAFGNLRRGRRGGQTTGALFG
jgi:transglutaminase-like putative cysteine protease